MFVQILNLYLVAIVCAAFASLAVSWRGIHIVSRNKSLQVLCIAQGAISGALLALLLKDIWEIEGNFELVLLGISSSFICGIAIGYFVENLGKSFVAEKPHLLFCVFILLIVANNLISSIFPQLETHMSQMFFGDLATLSDSEALVAIFIFAPLSFIGFRRRYLDTDLSFSTVVLNNVKNNTSLFDIALITYSVQSFGFLFTLGMILIPTTLARVRFVAGLNRHYFVTAVGASVGTLIGFVLSLISGNLPTVPMILLTACLTTLVFSRFFPNIQGFKK
ncbi:MAG: hypothetical protein KBD78_11880 [Oligoflexales bacterium]|nr:hypothetical protein [Oligoflexales bacterium]